MNVRINPWLIAANAVALILFRLAVPDASTRTVLIAIVWNSVLLTLIVAAADHDRRSR